MAATAAQVERTPARPMRIQKVEVGTTIADSLSSRISRMDALLGTLSMGDTLVAPQITHERDGSTRLTYPSANDQKPVTFTIDAQGTINLSLFSISNTSYESVFKLRIAHDEDPMLLQALSTDITETQTFNHAAEDRYDEAIQHIQYRLISILLLTTSDLDITRQNVASPQIRALQTLLTAYLEESETASNSLMQACANTARDMATINSATFFENLARLKEFALQQNVGTHLTPVKWEKGLITHDIYMLDSNNQTQAAIFSPKHGSEVDIILMQSTGDDVVIRFTDDGRVLQDMVRRLDDTFYTLDIDFRVGRVTENRPLTIDRDNLLLQINQVIYSLQGRKEPKLIAALERISHYRDSLYQSIFDQNIFLTHNLHIAPSLRTPGGIHIQAYRGERFRLTSRVATINIFQDPNDQALTYINFINQGHEVSYAISRDGYIMVDGKGDGNYTYVSAVQAEFMRRMLAKIFGMNGEISDNLNRKLAHLLAGRDNTEAMYAHFAGYNSSQFLLARRALKEQEQIAIAQASAPLETWISDRRQDQESQEASEPNFML